MKKIRIGLIGTGGICRGRHIPGYLECPECEITALCDINPKALQKTKDKFGFTDIPCFENYKDLLASGLVDAVDIATSNDVHVQIALDALDAGFPISIEKPIGINIEESLALLKKSKETGLPVFVCFSWRYNKFPRYMKYLIDNGEIGDIYHIYVKCIKDSGLWEGRRLEWRFDESKAGSGVLCDLGSHMFDAIRFFGQEINSVYCDRGIIVKKRQKLDSDEWADVTTDDWSNAVCMLDSGIGATVTLSRTTIAEKDTIEFYVSGSHGALRFNYQGGDQNLYICKGEDLKEFKFQPVSIPEDFKSLNQSRSFVNILMGIPDEYASTIVDGIRSQAAVDGAKLSSQCHKAIILDDILKGAN